MGAERDWEGSEGGRVIVKDMARKDIKREVELVFRWSLVSVVDHWLRLIV